MIIILESAEVGLAVQLAKALDDADFPAERWDTSSSIQCAMAALITHRINAFCGDEEENDYVPLMEHDDIVGLVDEMLTNPLFSFLTTIPVDHIELWDGNGTLVFFFDSIL